MFEEPGAAAFSTSGRLLSRENRLRKVARHATMMAAGRVVSLSPASPYALPTDGSFNRAPEVQPRAVGLSLVVGAHESCTDDGEYHRNDHEGKDAAECQLAVPSHLHALEHAERYEHDCN